MNNSHSIKKLVRFHLQRPQSWFAAKQASFLFNTKAALWLPSASQIGGKRVDTPWQSQERNPYPLSAAPELTDPMAEQSPVWYRSPKQPCPLQQTRFAPYVASKRKKPAYWMFLVTWSMSFWPTTVSRFLNLSHLLYRLHNGAVVFGCRIQHHAKDWLSIMALVHCVIIGKAIVNTIRLLRFGSSHWQW